MTRQSFRDLVAEARGLTEQDEPKLPEGEAWELYTDEPGWRKVAAKMTAIAKKAAKLLAAQKKKNVDAIAAARAVRNEIKAAWNTKEISRYGGHDSEPQGSLSRYLTRTAAGLWGFGRYDQTAAEVADIFYMM